jgi:hypothetical protein
MFKQVLIWGDKLFAKTIPLNIEDECNYKLHDKRGTFSYVYYGYYRAFNKLNYDVLWLDHTDDLTKFDFDETLIFAYNNTINIDVSKFPINKNSYYLLHNVYWGPYYKDLFKDIPLNQIIHLCLPIDKHMHNLLQRNDTIFYKNRFNYGQLIKGFGYIQMSLWATDLLPNEIRAINKNLLDNYDITNIEDLKTEDVYFVGTINHNNTLKEMIALLNDRINFKYVGGVNRNSGSITILDNIDLVRKSKLSLALQCSEQVEKEYCSCRIFKSISYGRMPLCSNPVVHEVISSEVICEKDYEKLYTKGLAFEKNPERISIMRNLILNIIDNHTFISRALSTINYFSKIR